MRKKIIDLRANILIIITQSYPHHSLLNIRLTKLSLKVISVPSFLYSP